MIECRVIEYCALWWCLAWCCFLQDAPEVIADSPSLPRRIESQHLPNLIQVHGKVLSGGLPVGPEAFRELSQLGIKTVVSVDAALPDTEMARRFGLRYVHLPHGYDGIPERRVAELAKAVLELEGPIYIHCHHGKHRSPTACGVACAAAGLIPESQVLAVLELAGTDPHYQGLYRAAKQVKRISDDRLSALRVEFKEIAEVTPLATAMVELEVTWDRVKQLDRSQWQSSDADPRLQPAPQALLLVEHFAEMLRNSETEKRNDEYIRFLSDSLDASRSLYDSLKSLEQSGRKAHPDAEVLSVLRRHLKTVGDNCRTCHHQFRDQ